jgi:hypothetical protein
VSDCRWQLCAGIALRHVNLGLGEKDTLAKICSSNVSISEIRTDEISAIQYGTSEINRNKISTSQICATEVFTSEVSSNEVSPPTKGLLTS